MTKTNDNLLVLLPGMGAVATTFVAGVEAVRRGMARPLGSATTWATSELFEVDNRRMLDIKLKEDHFLPLGDNSPASSDGRFWIGHQYVERDLLIGKALMIYWPHTWNRPVPYFPNFRKMQLIH